VDKEQIIWKKSCSLSSKSKYQNIVCCRVKVSIKILFVIAMVWLKIVDLSDISNIHLIYIL
jgi:hypothetical protein